MGQRHLDPPDRQLRQNATPKAKTSSTSSVADNEYNANLALWHRNIHFFGITPRIVFSYSKIDSNNKFYSYDTSKVYLDFSRSF